MLRWLMRTRIPIHQTHGFVLSSVSWRMHPYRQQTRPAGCSRVKLTSKPTDDSDEDSGENADIVTTSSDVVNVQEQSLFLEDVWRSCPWLSNSLLDDFFSAQSFFLKDNLTRQSLHNFERVCGTSCDGQKIATCEDTDGDSCVEFSIAVDCPTPGEFCDSSSGRGCFNCAK